MPGHVSVRPHAMRMAMSKWLDGVALLRPLPYRCQTNNGGHALNVPAMSVTALLQRRTVRLYALGQGLILLGAGLMDYFGSVIPLALCASAAIMLCTPLVRELATRLLNR